MSAHDPFTCRVCQAAASHQVLSDASWRGPTGLLEHDEAGCSLCVRFHEGHLSASDDEKNRQDAAARSPLR